MIKKNLYQVIHFSRIFFLISLMTNSLFIQQNNIYMTQANNTAIKYGSFTLRFTAAVIDLLVLVITNLLIFLGISAIMESVASDESMATMFYSEAFGEIELWFLIALVLMSCIISWIYFAIMESSKYQGSLGKLTVGFMVTDLSFNHISFKKASYRFWGKLLSVLIVGMGFVFGLFNKRKQCLHDFVSSTVVIDINQYW